MNIIHKNYKEDLKLLIDLGAQYKGEAFKITFTAGNYGLLKFECSFDGVSYTNCAKVDDTHILCLLDNHGLPCGLVCADIELLLPDSGMPDGNFKLSKSGLLEFTYLGEKCHLELIDGQGNNLKMCEVTMQLLGTVLRGEKGDKGDKGDPGEPGPQGPMGEGGVSEEYVNEKINECTQSVDAKLADLEERLTNMINQISQNCSFEEDNDNNPLT